MSRDLSPAELHICRMVVAFLAIMVFAFLVFNAIDFLFSPAPPVRTVQRQPGTTRSTPNPKQANRSSPLVPQKEPAGDVVPAEPAQASPAYMKAWLEQLGQITLEKSQSSPAKLQKETTEDKEPAGDAVSAEPTQPSLSYMKARLQQLGQMTLEKSIWFDAQALDRGRDPNSVVAAIAEPATTETSPPWKAGVITASATTTELLATESPQEIKLQPEPTAPRPQPESKEASLGTASFTPEPVSQVKSRLRDLGYLSAAKGDEWDTDTRNALRDFKLVNHLPNDDVWDLQTSTKLNSQTAIRADQSIIGNWATGACRSPKNENTRLSISARRIKSSTGSVCEFRFLQSNNREWRMRADCSQGSQHWVANGRLALAANKLLWTSDRDVISYFRCN
jgi:hypothetical protein